MGSSIQEKIHGDNVGKVRRAAGTGDNLRRLLQRGATEVEERPLRLANESVGAKKEEQCPPRRRKVRLPDEGYTRIRAKGLWALGGLTVSTVVGHRTDHKPYAKRWVEAVVKPGEDGAYVRQHLSFISLGKVHGRKAKASNRTMGNPAVRH